MERYVAYHTVHSSVWPPCAVMSRDLRPVCMYAVMNINMSCHSWHLLSWLYTYTCVHLKTFTCTALTSLAWCVHGARLFHTPSTTHQITAILSHIAIQLHKLGLPLWSARTWVTLHVLPSLPPAHRDTGGGTVREVTAGQRLSTFDKDSEIDWFCALRKDWMQSNILCGAIWSKTIPDPCHPNVSLV